MVHWQLVGVDVGLSVLGTKTLVMTDAPLLAVHDTGGLFGETRLLRADPDSLADRARFLACWVAKSTQLVATCRFPQPGVTVGFIETGEDARCIEDNFLRRFWSAPDGEFCVNASSISATVTFRAGEVLAGVLKADKALGSVADELASDCVDPRLSLCSFYEATKALSALKCAAVCAATFNEILVAPSIANGRLVLRAFNGAELGNLDVRTSTITRAERTVSVEGRLMLGGAEATRVDLHFPAEDIATAFLENLSIGQPPSSKASPDVSEAALMGELVHVRGFLARRGVDSRNYEVALEGNGLSVIDAVSRQVLHCFDLSATATGISGTDDSVLVVDDNEGPIAVSSMSEEFRKQLLDSSAIHHAAMRTSEAGPFLALDAERRPIVLSFGDDVVSIRREGKIFAILPDAVEPPKEIVPGVLPAMQIHCDDVSFQVAADRVLIEEMAARTAVLVLGDKTPQELARGAHALEGAWLMDTIFSPAVNLHREICRQQGGDPDRPRVTDEMSDEAAQELVALFASRIRPLQRSCVRAVNVLPEFLVQRDAALFASAAQRVPPGLASMRRSTSSALLPLLNVAAELSRIDSVLGRLDAYRRAQQRSSLNFGGLLISGFASLVNPLALIGVAQQAHTLLSQHSRSEAQGAVFVREAAGEALELWNYLVAELLPPCAAKVLEALASSRADLYRTIERRVSSSDANARLRLVESLTLRYARLQTYVRFPSEIDPAVPRAHLVEAVEGMMEGARPPPFRRI